MKACGCCRETKDFYLFSKNSSRKDGLILYSTKKGFRSANDFAFVDEERLEYVHQLQNLYFVVMGKKLIIKTKLHGKQ